MLLSLILCVAIWNYKGDVVLLGDAAHGVGTSASAPMAVIICSHLELSVPFLGLGINAGFEGVRHMINLLDKYKRPDGTFDFEKVFLLPSPSCA